MSQAIAIIDPQAPGTQIELAATGQLITIESVFRPGGAQAVIAAIKAEKERLAAEAKRVEAERLEQERIAREADRSAGASGRGGAAGNVEEREMSDTIEITNAHHAKLVNEAVALTVACEHIRLLLAVAKKSPEPAGDWDRAAQWVAIDRAERFLRENGT